ncbi:MAG: D-ribose pyranase [Thermomicrobiales bacterium]|nr:D-ribose pyranase [Thermomicrobiales bacterium]
MKKQGILNAALAETIAGLGHTDWLVVADAGLPIPPGVPVIDLAVRCGVPSFADVLAAVAAELQVEHIVIAAEAQQTSDPLPEIAEHFPGVPLTACPHDEFKQRTARARAVVRTGECTPYHNVLLQAGVIF